MGEYSTSEQKAQSPSQASQHHQVATSSVQVVQSSEQQPSTNPPQAPVVVVSSVPHHAPSSDGLLPLEPPLSSSDYSFSLDDQENLNDLFDLF